MAEGGGSDDEDKTEDPTQKKLDEALKRGDVVKSQEVSTFFILAACMAFLIYGSPQLGRSLVLSFRAFLDHIAEISIDQAGLTGLYMQIGKIVALGLGLPALIFIIAGVAGNMVQHRIVWSLKPITPQFSRLSPLSGLKRLFSAENMANFAKGLIKLIVVSAGIYLAVRPEMVKLDSIMTSGPLAIMGLTQDMVIKLMMAVMIVMAVVAGADYVFQRQRFTQRMRMSRHELKEEFKQSEGNPEIKAKIRQLRQMRARRRMMAQVPKATVIVTNPTHYAVALRYDDEMGAPQCVAKGTDLVALKIREIAGQHDVPIVENPPLARALYASVEIDQIIPEEHYRAVAEVVAFVMRQKRR